MWSFHSNVSVDSSPIAPQASLLIAYSLLDNLIFLSEKEQEDFKKHRVRTGTSNATSRITNMHRQFEVLWLIKAQAKISLNYKKHTSNFY